MYYVTIQAIKRKQTKNNTKQKIYFFKFMIFISLLCNFRTVSEVYAFVVVETQGDQSTTQTALHVTHLQTTHSSTAAWQ